MVRVSKDYNERKKEILDTAQRLFYENGYEQTSVNTIIEEIGISKGTFYYYFKSKEELLDSLVERSAVDVTELIKKITDDDKLNALQKLNQIFLVSGRWKVSNWDIVLIMLEVIYRDENIIIRHKMNEKSIELVTPELVKVVKQGVSEGTFNTPFPDEIAELILRIGDALSNSSARFLLELSKKPENITLIKKNISLYENAVEKILGLPEGSITMVDKETMKEILRVTKKTS
jgi:AcrR family transcriptional regulator